MRQIDNDKIFCAIGKLTVTIIGMCAFATGPQLISQALEVLGL